jgi:hypothetical protein
MMSNGDTEICIPRTSFQSTIHLPPFRMGCLLALPMGNAIGTISLCLFVLYAAVIIFFLFFAFAGAFVILGVYGGLRHLRLQI